MKTERILECLNLIENEWLKWDGDGDYYIIDALRDIFTLELITRDEFNYFNNRLRNLNEKWLLDNIKKYKLSVKPHNELIEKSVEDIHGNQFRVSLPYDAIDIGVITDIDGEVRVNFKTRFGGEDYVDTYIKTTLNNSKTKL